MKKRRFKRAISRMICMGMAVLLLAFGSTGQMVCVEAEGEYYPAGLTIQQGVTLNCWGWSFQDIKDNMRIIAETGFPNILVSPVQPTNTSTAGLTFADWEKMYDITGYTFDETGALGTKAEFTAMCEEANKYNVRVLVEVVVDLNVNDSTEADVAAQVKMLLQECMDAGADGFCFKDGGKIDSSSFWEQVALIKQNTAGEGTTGETDVYLYADIDNYAGVAEEAYTANLPITDDAWATKVRGVVSSGSTNYGQYEGSYNRAADGDNLVICAETYEEYMNGTTSNVSAADINKAWALTAGRADAMGVYLARPKSADTPLGTASTEDWKAKEVETANKFHNYFAWDTESLSSASPVVYAERGQGGAIVVNCGGNSTSVSLTRQQMEDGTFTDQITGSTFTVSNGKLSGNIGSTGIAVIYNAVGCRHPEHDVNGICSTCMTAVPHAYNEEHLCTCGAIEPVAERVQLVYFNNATGYSDVYVYTWRNGDGEKYTGDWPGTLMKYDEQAELYTYQIPAGADMIIFNDGNGNQTDDLELVRCGVYGAVGIIDSRHDHLEELVEEAKKVPGTSCTDNQCYYYTCEYCGETMDTFFEVKDSATEHSDMDDDGLCDNCGNTIMEGIGAALGGYSLSLAGNIGVNFYMELTAEVAGNTEAYMHFELPNGTAKDVKVADATVTERNNKTYHVFCCEVAAKEMTADIKATMVVGEERGTTYNYTVEDYAKYILADETQTDGIKALVTTMLNYGAAAQEYFDYAADALANRSLSDADRAAVNAVAADAVEAYVKEVTADITGISYYGTSTVLKTKTGFRHYFTLEDGADISEYTFTVNGSELTPIAAKGMYYVEIANISAKNLQTDYTITVTKGAETQTITYCIYDYVHDVLNSTTVSDTLKKVGKAIYLYGQAANAYAVANN